MSEELKPCPFCGGEDLSVHFDDGFSCYVWCGDCGSKTDNRHPTKKEAIKAWNTRPTEDALKAENERLKAENVRIKTMIAFRINVLHDMIENHQADWNTSEYYSLCRLLGAINNMALRKEKNEQENL